MGGHSVRLDSQDCTEGQASTWMKTFFYHLVLCLIRTTEGSMVKLSPDALRKRSPLNDWETYYSLLWISNANPPGSAGGKKSNRCQMEYRAELGAGKPTVGCRDPAFSRTLGPCKKAGCRAPAKNRGPRHPTVPAVGPYGLPSLRAFNLKAKARIRP